MEQKYRKRPVIVSATLEGGHIVCPGDFIITGMQGERYPCKADIFCASYEIVSEEP